MRPTATSVIYATHLHFWIKNCRIQGFNTFALHKSFEADLLAMTQAGYVHEVEIKVSRADFKKDFEKAGMHNDTGKWTGWKPNTQKHQLIKDGKLANYFWFAAPAGLIKPEEIPPYAGLIEVLQGYRNIAVVSVKAPKIHGTKVPDKFKSKLLESMMYRAWKIVEQKKDLELALQSREAEIALLKKGGQA